MTNAEFMKNSGPGIQLRFHHLWQIGLAALICLAIAIALGCQSEPAPTKPAPTIGDSTVEAKAGADSDSEDAGADSGQSSSPSSGEDEGDGHGDGGSDSNGGANGDAGTDSGTSSTSSADGDIGGDSDGDAGTGSDGDSGSDTASNQNPGGEGVSFDGSRNAALMDAPPLEVVTWTVEPSISAGALVAEGTLEQGARLFDAVSGDGSAFSVYYIGWDEPLVVLLPRLGQSQVWDTLLTVAPTDIEIAGASFKIRAHSPLFRDVGGAGLELHVYGVDQSGADALLAVQVIAE